MGKKVLAALVVVVFMIGLSGCPGEKTGGGTGNFDECVKTSIEVSQKAAGGNAPEDVLKTAAEGACQACKVEGGAEACQKIIDELKKVNP